VDAPHHSVATPCAARRRAGGDRPSQGPSGVATLVGRSDRGEARNETRTRDPFLTMEVLYQLSYPGAGIHFSGARGLTHRSPPSPWAAKRRAQPAGGARSGGPAGPPTRAVVAAAVGELTSAAARKLPVRGGDDLGGTQSSRKRWISWEKGGGTRGHFASGSEITGVRGRYAASSRRETERSQSTCAPIRKFDTSGSEMLHYTSIGDVTWPA
jgi:hypothetical protein